MGSMIALLFAIRVAHAGDIPSGSGDVTWVLVSTAMVLLMTPALAMFYGGMVRSKNVISTILHSFFAMGLVTIQWVIFGYSLAFSEGNAFIGGLDYLFLQGVGTAPGPYAAHLPHNLFMAFQMMFAIITPALISGAFAERMRFSAYVLLTLLWTTLVYDPVCHWVWGIGGWLRDLGALDFAGGTVVHVNSGVAALVTAMVLGRRLQAGDPLRPHNLGLTVLGAGLLWFGWFGFNAGSALAANGVASHALVTTHIAAGTAMVVWAMAEHFHHGRATSIGMASGAVSGLVAITPACGFVDIFGALMIGLGAGLMCYGGILLKERLRYDDSLDAFGIHGLGGAWGALATGLFASSTVGGVAGLLEGANVALMGVQLLSIFATLTYSLIVTWIILMVIDRTVGLRVSEEEEQRGLDSSLHQETAYNLFP